MQDKTDTPIRIIQWAGAIVLVLTCVLLSLVLLWWVGFPVSMATVWLSSLVLSFALRPYFKVTDRLKLPRSAAFLFANGAVVAIMVLIAVVVVPVVTEQVHELVVRLPREVPTIWQELKEFIARYNPSTAASLDVYVQDHISSTTDYLSYFGNVANGALGVVTTVASKSGYWLMVVWVTLSLVTSDNLLKYPAERYFFEHKDDINQVIDRIREDIGNWAWAQLFISGTLGISFGLLLFFYGVPFSWAIGFITVFVDIVPFGNVLALGFALLAVLVDMPNHLLYQSLWESIYVLVVWTVLTQIEGSVLQPRVMNRVLHVHPVLILSFVFIGFAVQGVLGALLGIPVLLAFRAVLEKIYKDKRPQQPALARERTWMESLSSVVYCRTCQQLPAMVRAVRRRLPPYKSLSKIERQGP
jgi:predicted PurR-regulated permease PerM